MYSAILSACVESMPVLVWRIGGLQAVLEQKLSHLGVWLLLGYENLVAAGPRSSNEIAMHISAEHCKLS
jgi:hypothetical protein